MDYNSKFEVEGKVLDGAKFNATQPDYFRKVLAKFIGKEICLTIEPLVKKRSVRQNRYYWGVVVNYIKDYVYSTQGEKMSNDEIHYFNITGILGIKPEIKKIHDQEFIVIDYKKTSEMTTIEFNIFVETIVKYWAEKGLVIPEPKL